MKHLIQPVQALKSRVFAQPHKTFLVTTDLPQHCILLRLLPLNDCVSARRAPITQL